MHRVHWNDAEKHFYVMDGDTTLTGKPKTYKALQVFLRNKRITKYSMTSNAFRAARRQGMKG